MPVNSDDQASLTAFLIFLDKWNEQCRALAKKLDQERKIYYAYAWVDSQSSAYSIFKYFFDICAEHNDPDSMHELMLTPECIAVIAVESLFLVSFALLAVEYDQEKQNFFKKLIAALWPYFRDLFKALKNTYKGWRSTISVLNIIGDVKLDYLVTPVGIILGVILAANRFWLRYAVIEPRKKMMKDNGSLLKQIKQFDIKIRDFTLVDSEYYLEQIKKQPDDIRLLAYFAMGLGGCLDSLYLYVGVLGLASLSYPVVVVLAALCVVYTLLCIVTRLYAEYEFQLKLFITHTQCRLEVTSKLMETTFNNLMDLQNKPNKTANDLEALLALKAEFVTQLIQFQQYRQELNGQLTLSTLTAVLYGIKNGLFAYGAIVSILFVLSAASLLFLGMNLPPVLLIMGVFAGIVATTGFVVYLLFKQGQQVNKQQALLDQQTTRLQQLQACLETMQIDQVLDALIFQQFVDDGSAKAPATQFYFLEWFEVIRSFFSGIGKGQKFVEFIFNFLQELDDHGHYHDTDIMGVLILCCSSLFGLILAVRAMVQGLGRVPLGQEPLEEKTAVNGNKPIGDKQEDVAELEPPRVAEVENQPDLSQVPLRSPLLATPQTPALSVWGMFHVKNIASSASSADYSEAAAILSHTTPDLISDRYTF